MVAPERVFAAVAVLTAVVLALPTVAAAASAEDEPGRIGIRLAEAPVDRADDPRAQRYVVDHLDPGATITRQIEVWNDTHEALAIELYPGAAEIREGRWRPADGRAANELTSWVSTDPAVLEVPAGASRRATVTIAVDAAATAGEHYAVVWAQPPPAQRGQVEVVNRVGIRVYLSVGPGGEPPTEFAITGLGGARSADGTPTVEVAVDNTGGRALDLRGEVELTAGPGGASAGPFPVPPRTTVAIGESASVLVPVDPQLPRGPWRTTATLTSGTVERSASAEITFPALPGEAAALVPPEARGPGWGLLVTLAGVLLGLAIAFLSVAVVTGRRREAEDDAGDEASADAPTLELAR